MCGIAGIINTKKQKFDYSTFCTLGIANDSRGGDSCGIFIDGKYQYGVNENKLFQNFFLNNEIIDKTKECEIALVHCRKASVGVIKESTAQPVVLTNEEGKVLFVLMHNGTIHNYKELAKKYIPEVDITGMTDSQVMARIFYYVGYDVLDEYIGGAVFAIVDYRQKQPVTLLFKGASKKSEYSKEATEERPLFYTISKGELVFSSLGIWLCALRKNQDVFSLKENTLIKFSENHLYIVKKYSRENAYQTEKISTIYSSVNKYFDYSVYSASKYISIDYSNNIYMHGGKPLHGEINLTDHGKIESNNTKYSTLIYFYNGVALKNKACFNFLDSLYKETKLSFKDFCVKFKNVIRFLSIDQIYKTPDLWVKATSPSNYIPYTGTLQALTSTSRAEFANGYRRATTWGQPLYTLEKIIKQPYDINFKTIKEQCKPLMILLEN